MTRHEVLACWLAVLAFAIARSDDSLSATVSKMDNPNGIELLDGEWTAVAEGVKGTTVLRSDRPFQARFDLKEKKIEPRKYDLLKLQVKADARAMLQVSLENYPEPGLMSHWYLFGKTRAAFDWETVYVDLYRPEEIKPAGAYKGLDKEDPTLRGLRLSGSVADMKRASQPDGRRIWLGPIRFVKKAVDLDWDQRKAPYNWEKGKDLVFRYPLTLTNRLDRAATALVELTPIKAEHATGKVAESKVTLKPGETKTVEVSLSLPAAIASKKPPLYAERFLVRARAEGIDDSDVTILRSSDPVELTVTVPIPDEKLKFPLLPRRKDIPDSITGFSRNRQTAEGLAEQVKPQDLHEAVGDGVSETRKEGKSKGLFPWQKSEAAERYLDGLTASAFLYDATGDKKYLEKGKSLLLAAAEKFPPLRRSWEKGDVVEISHGVFAMNTLRLGWSTGSMRWPYAYQHHGMFNNFDMLAADMDAKDRQRILDDFLVPAAIQMRNHAFGLGNQQDVVNYAILYAGIAARNWPLVSFAYDSDLGLRNQLAWDFNDDGLAGEGHYHTPAIRPILYMTELLYRVGIDLYDERLNLILRSPAAEAIGKPFRDTILDYLDKHRFAGKNLGIARKKTDGHHLASGVTLLRQGSLEVSMNWGTHIHRGAHDRSSLTISAPERHPLHRIGGGNYTHSSLGQSILIVDESRQEPVPAKVTGHHIDGAIQFVQSTSDEHFPGTSITRTFALVGGHVLVLDRVRSDRPRTIDWCLRYRGDTQSYKEVADGVSLPLEHRKGSFTDKAADKARGIIYGAELRSEGHYVATSSESWRQKQGAMVVAKGDNTRVMVFAVPASFSATQKERVAGVPVLMARRANVKQTDFIVAFSSAVKEVKQVEVTRADSKPADAIGVEVTLEDGKSFRALANYEAEGVVVRLGNLKTTKKFATDYPVD